MVRICVDSRKYHGCGGLWRNSLLWCQIAWPRHPDLTDDEVATLNRIESELKLRGYAGKTQKSQAPGHPVPCVCRGPASGGGGASPGERHRQRSHVDPRASGKGRKDRYTLLPKSILEDLQSYWKAYRPSTWLFPGARKGRHLTERSVQKVVSRAVLGRGDPQAGNRAYAETQLCDAPAGRRDRSAIHPGAPRPQKLQDDGDLHPREAEGSGADREPTRHAVGLHPVLNRGAVRPTREAAPSQRDAVIQTESSRQQ